MSSALRSLRMAAPLFLALGFAASLAVNATKAEVPAIAEAKVELSGEDLLGDNYQKLWRGYKTEEWPKGWEVKDGVLARVGAGGDLVTKAKYQDFRLSLEWKISKNGNSGIMYRCRLGDDAPYFSGPEYQILDNSGHQDGKNSSTSTASLYALYAPEKDWTKKPGEEWNKTIIVVRGNHIQHWLNGHKTVDCKLGSDDWNQRVAKSKFKDWKQFSKSAEGHIALQDHGDLVWYRNIRISRLSEKDNAKPASN